MMHGPTLASAAAPARLRSSFNPTVHGARGLFASAIYFFHVVNSGLATYPALATPVVLFMLRSSEYGVELFFCISGFVIAGALRRARSIPSFIIDRMIRIFPVLWATIAVISVLGFISGTHGFQQLSESEYFLWLPANLLALPGVFPIPAYHPAAWSLSYEAVFYISAAAAAWCLAARHSRNLFFAAAPFAVLALAVYPRAIFFVSGVLVAQGLLDRPRIAGLIRYPTIPLLIFLACWEEIQALSPTLLADETMFDWWHDYRLPLAVVAFAAATIFFAGLATGHGVLGRLLRSRVLLYLGTISYSFYLWHPIIMSVIKHGLIVSGLAGKAGSSAQLLFLVLALPPSLLLAHYSQRVLEQGAGLWLRRRLHHPAPLATPAPLAAPAPFETSTPALAEASTPALVEVPTPTLVEVPTPPIQGGTLRPA